MSQKKVWVMNRSVSLLRRVYIFVLLQFLQCAINFQMSRLAPLGILGDSPFSQREERSYTNVQISQIMYCFRV